MIRLPPRLPPRLRLYWQALRPYAFPATLMPLLCATLLAWRQGAWRSGSLAASLLMAFSALALHAGVNMLNDYYDFTLGFDRAGGSESSALLTRGIVAPPWMRRRGHAALLLAALAGIPLALWRSPWLLLLGSAGLAGALLYSHRHGYKYLGLGEPLVFLLMGPLLFAAAYLAVAQKLAWRVVWLSLPFGALVTAIMLVNNLRDLEEDGRAGFRTLPVRLGVGCGRWLFVLLLLMSLALTLLWVAKGWLPPLSLTTLLAAVTLFPLGWRVLRARNLSSELANGPQLAAASDLLYGLLLAASLIWG